MLRFLLFVCIVSVVFAHTCAGQGSPECEVNSEPKPCGSLCEPTCDNPKKILCNPADKNSCKNECRCVDGTVRNPRTRQCIPLRDCPKNRRARQSESPKCSSNEKPSLCGQMCEPTCENPKPNRRWCPRLQCTWITQACRCKDGYLRNASKKCVLPQNCDKSGD